MNRLARHTRRLELRAVGGLKIEADPVSVLADDHAFRSRRGSRDGRRDLRAHLVAARKDRGAERRDEPRSRDPEATERQNRLAGDPRRRPAPAGVNRCRGRTVPVRNEDGDTVGGPDRGHAPRRVAGEPQRGVRLRDAGFPGDPNDARAVDLFENRRLAREPRGAEEPPPSPDRLGIAGAGGAEIEAVPAVRAARRERVGDPRNRFESLAQDEHEAVDRIDPEPDAHGAPPAPALDTSERRRRYSPWMDFSRLVAEARREHQRALDAFLERHAADLERLASWCAEALGNGAKVLLFGNGGSAADAQHLAAEFVNRFDRDRPALSALALATDGSVLTSIGNDSEFRRVFARQVEAHGRPGDVAVGITTSGVSPNVLAGLEAARRIGLRTAALLGRDGGPVAQLAEIALVVPAEETARIQEVHIFAGHLLCRRVEDLLEASRRGKAPLTSSS